MKFNFLLPPNFLSFENPSILLFQQVETCGKKSKLPQNLASSKTPQFLSNQADVQALLLFE